MLPFRWSCRCGPAPLNRTPGARASTAGKRPRRRSERENRISSAWRPGFRVEPLELGHERGVITELGSAGATEPTPRLVPEPVAPPTIQTPMSFDPPVDRVPMQAPCHQQRRRTLQGVRERDPVARPNPRPTSGPAPTPAAPQRPQRPRRPQVAYDASPRPFRASRSALVRFHRLFAASCARRDAAYGPPPRPPPAAEARRSAGPAPAGTCAARRSPDSGAVDPAIRPPTAPAQRAAPRDAERHQPDGTPTPAAPSRTCPTRRSQRSPPTGLYRPHRTPTAPASQPLRPPPTALAVEYAFPGAAHPKTSRDALRAQRARHHCRSLWSSRG